MADKQIDQVQTGLKDEPIRRFTYGGHVAHLIAYGHDFGAQPYVEAYCGYAPEWGAAWLGSGTQREEDEVTQMRTCKRCNKCAQETADFVNDLKVFLADPPAKGRKGLTQGGVRSPHEPA